MGLRRSLSVTLLGRLFCICSLHAPRAGRWQVVPQCRGEVLSPRRPLLGRLGVDVAEAEGGRQGRCGYGADEAGRGFAGARAASGGGGGGGCLWGRRGLQHGGIWRESVGYGSPELDVWGVV